MEVIQMLVRRAKAEDLEATKILLAYTFGKPKEYHEHSGGVLIRIVDDSDSQTTDGALAAAPLEAGVDSENESETNCWLMRGDVLARLRLLRASRSTR